MDALRALSIVYRNATHGHPRIYTFITQAMKDHVLLLRPLLHADVIVYQLDETFAVGSQLYSKDSRTADWERMTSRLPGDKFSADRVAMYGTCPPPKPSFLRLLEAQLCLRSLLHRSQDFRSPATAVDGRARSCL